MQTQQPYVPPQGPPGQYDFIMNHNGKPKRKLLGGFGRTQRIIVFVVAGLVIIIVIFSLFSSLLSKGGIQEDKLIAIAQQQTEIARISDQGLLKSQNVAVRSLALTVKLSVNSEQNQLIDFLKTDANKKVGPKELAGGKKTSNDTAIAEAAKNNRVDDAILQLLKSSLADYQASLKKEYDSTSNAKEKQLLSNLYSQITPLIK